VPAAAFLQEHRVMCDLVSYRNFGIWCRQDFYRSSSHPYTFFLHTITNDCTNTKKTDCIEDIAGVFVEEVDPVVLRDTEVPVDIAKELCFVGAIIAFSIDDSTQGFGPADNVFMAMVVCTLRLAIFPHSGYLPVKWNNRTASPCTIPLASYIWCRGEIVW